MPQPILAILTPARAGDTLIAAALAEARRSGAPLTVVYLEDSEREDLLRDCLASRGFVGPRQMQAVSDLAHDSAHEAGRERLVEVAATAAAVGVPCDTRIAAGPFADSIERLARELGAGRVFVSRGRIGALTRLFGERDFARLKRHFGDRLTLVEPSAADTPP